LTAGDSYAGKTDYQVLAMAQAAYRRAEALPPRSGQRRAEWEAFDSAMCELMRRAMSHVLWRIHEMEAAGEDNVPDGSDAAVILELIERNGSGTAGEPSP
jgi:hypothetical protein